MIKTKEMELPPLAEEDKEAAQKEALKSLTKEPWYLCQGIKGATASVKKEGHCIFREDGMTIFPIPDFKAGDEKLRYRIKPEILERESLKIENGQFCPICQSLLGKT